MMSSIRVDRIDPPGRGGRRGAAWRSVRVSRHARGGRRARSCGRCCPARIGGGRRRGERRGRRRGRAAHPDGFFVADARPQGAVPYRLRVIWDGASAEFDDAYRFPPVLGDLDVHLLAEGTHLDSYRKLGAHVTTLDGVEGVAFAVWAPNAQRVSVVGEFDALGRPPPADAQPPRRRVLGNFRAGDRPGRGLQIRDRRAGRRGAAAQGRPLCARRPSRRRAPPRSSPRRRRFPGRTASGSPMRGRANDRASPISIYEVHLGSWRRDLARGRPISELPRAGRAAGAVCRRSRLHPYRDHADHRVPVRRVVGLSAGIALRADLALWHAGRFPLLCRCLPPRRARRVARLGAGAFPERRARARAGSTAPRSTSTPTRARACTAIGTR